MTYSLVAFDPDSGECGVAVQSHWFSVGGLVTWGEPGVGAVATQANVEIALRLWPRLLKDDGVLRIADPRRAGTRDFLAAARGTFDLVSERRGDDVALHTLRPCRR